LRRGGKMLSHCPASEDLLAYYLNEMTVSDRSRTHDHMAGCDACVLRLLDMARTDTFLQHHEDTAVPEALFRLVSSRNHVHASAAPTKPSLPILAIRLARSSIQLLKDTLMPDSVQFNWVQALAPAMSFRSGESDSRKQLRIEQSLSGQNLSLQLIPADLNQIDLEIRVAQSDLPTSGVRVLFKKNNAIVHSQKTDAFGSLVISHVQPGQYRLQIPARQIDWMIDIQPDEG